MNPENEPFFIVGVHRSGTTLLRYMLSSHPRIYIPPESEFIPRFFQADPREALQPDRAKRILNEIFHSYRFSKEWRGDFPDPQHFIDGLPNLRPQTLLDGLYREYASQYGAQRWGDKTPVYTSYMDLIMEIFPSSRFIHIIRDGRDVVLSMIETWGEKKLHVDPYYAAASWVKRIHHALYSANNMDPGRYHQLRYEDLVLHPEPELKKICHFLGEEFHQSMAKPHILGKQHIPEGSFHTKVRRPLDTTSIGRWRRELSHGDQKIVQIIAGDTLSLLGYEPGNFDPMQLDERVRFEILKIKYHTFQLGRSLLQLAGVYHPN